MIRKLMTVSAPLLAALAVPLAAHAAPAAKFLTDAIQGSSAEVKMGQLAQSKSTSPKVRQFGATLEADHSRAKGMALAVAKREGVNPPDTIKPDAQAMYDHLQGLSGAEFDKAFVQHMVQDHREDIAKFEAQAKTGDAMTAKLAKDTLPDLKKHLAIAQSLK